LTLDDAIFNWLQIKYVAEQRKDDGAAQDTMQFFEEMLEEDFKLEGIKVVTDEGMYVVNFVHEGKEREKRHPVEFVRQLFLDIESEPKYN
jgi:hypothetical protein